MATTVTPASLTVTITEQYTLNNVSYGNTINKTFTTNGEIYQRIMAVKQSEITSLIDFGSADGRGTVDKTNYTYFRITNLDDTNFLTLTITSGDTFFYKLKAGDSKSDCETANKDYYAEETYDDYPQAATNNAKRAIKYKEENGSDCGTVVGWTRARQLANREKLSRSTIARMASFKRHQQHKDVPYDEGCGGIMWDAWGGDAGIEWAIKKLEQIDKKNMAKKRKYYSDDEHDHHFHFTQEMMETLHEEGELEVKVEEDEKEMVILFTYGEQESEEYTPEEEEEIKDKFEDYFDEVIKSLKDSK